MTDLNYTSGNNIGGNLLARFAPVAGIDTLPATGGAPVFRDGCRWYDVYGTLETKNFQEDHNDTDNGSVWKTTVQLWLPGDSADRRKVLAEMVRHRFVLEVEDNAGLRRRAGTLVQSLKFSYEFKTGAAMGDRRGYMLSFQGESTAPALIIP